MNFFTESDYLNDYLLSSEAIDHNNPKIRFVAKWLMDSMMKNINENPDSIRWPDPEMELANLTFDFVRDHIKHSADIASTKVVWQASDVLQFKEGLCYGKSHLLAALLRCNGIPSGLCYQYLRLEDDDQSPLIIHSLNAVYFQSIDRWIRLDARGNKNGVNAEFNIEQEQIAFPVRPGLGETDLPVIMKDTDRAVLIKLKKHENLQALMADLPTRIAGAS